MPEKIWKMAHIMGLGHGELAAAENAADVMIDMCNRLKLRGEDVKIVHTSYNEEKSLKRDQLWIQLAVYTDQEIGAGRIYRIPDKVSA